MTQWRYNDTMSDRCTDRHNNTMSDTMSDRYTDRQIHGQTDTQTDRYTDTQTDSQINSKKLGGEPYISSFNQNNRRKKFFTRKRKSKIWKRKLQ